MATLDILIKYDKDQLLIHLSKYLVFTHVITHKHCSLCCDSIMNIVTLSPSLDRCLADAMELNW